MESIINLIRRDQNVSPAFRAALTAQEKQAAHDRRNAKARKELLGDHAPSRSYPKVVTYVREVAQ